MSEFHRTSRWITFRNKVKPIITASLPQPCVNAGADPTCTGMVYPGQTFEVAHRTSHHLDPFQPLDIALVGPAHPKCNRRAGWREGRAKQLRHTQPDNNLPQPGSGWI